MNAAAKPDPRAGAEAALEAAAARATELCVRLNEISKATLSVNTMMARGNLEGALASAQRLDALCESLHDAGLPRRLQGHSYALCAHLRTALRGA